jgi:hypothetical protein
MTVKRVKKPKSGGASVRFILSNPKSSSRLKLADHLFSTESPRRNRSLLTKSTLGKNHPPQPSRIAATVLTATCLCSGLALVVLGILYGQWLVTLLGPPVLWYGLVRVRGARRI